MSPHCVAALCRREGLAPNLDYRRSDRFRHPTTRPNELWQTDFTYLRVVGWGWYDLSTVLDDDSCYVLAWTVSTTRKASDVTETLDLARAKAVVDEVVVVHRPRLLSDNGPRFGLGEGSAALSSTTTIGATKSHWTM